MKLLFLAPQPFFQERGTPIAVRLALEVIAERFKEHPEEKNFSIDLLCYHEGIDLEIPGVRIKRIAPPAFIRTWLKNITPGISIKKLICDVFFFFKTLKLVIENRHSPYTLVHAVEESVFIALFVKLFWRVPYIYDMDSSLAMQLSEKWKIFRPVYPLLSWFEGIAVKQSLAVAPVCDSLGIIAEKYGARSMVVLRDISLLNGASSEGELNLKLQTSLPAESKIILYVGNLEKYQGIDLMIDSFSVIMNQIPEWRLVIIGGNESDIENYKKIVAEKGAAERIILAGPRPVAMLGNYIKQADMLVSPRIRGNNTPMKIYSYLHSGKALLATDLPTHTQVLTPEVCRLSPPETRQFSSSMLELAKDERERDKLSSRAYELAEKNYTYTVFSRELNRLYDLLDTAIAAMPKRSNA